MKVMQINKNLRLYKRISISKQIREKVNDLSFQKQQYDPIKSLFLKHRNNNDYSTSQILRKNLDHIMARQNNIHLQSEKGSQEEKQRYDHIDQEANERLDDIAQSNISREQLLGINKKGPAIKSNPFFNLIRNNLEIRKSYLKDRAAYTVQNIVELAIRQDVGYDDAASASGKRVVLPYEDEKDPLKKRYSREMYKKANMLQESKQSDYYTSRQEIKEVDYQQKNPLESYRPIEKIDYYKKDIHISKEQIHWRNTPLLAQFMSVYGNIKHRKHSRLDFVTHQRIEQAIKRARKLRLLPTFSYLKSYHKKPLKTLAEDIQNETNIEVDLDSGMIYRRVQEPEIDFQESKNYFKHTLMFYDNIQIQKEKKDEDDIFIDATNYAMLQKKDEMHKKNMQYYNDIVYTSTIPKFKNLENLDRESLKQSYQKLQEKIQGISYQDFLYLLISEFTQDYQMLEGIISISKNMKEIQKNQSEESYQDLLDQLKQLKQKYVENDENINKREIDYLMSLYQEDLEINQIQC